MKRRTFLTTPIMLAAAQVSPTRQRNLLASLWSSDDLAKAARRPFHPFPAAAERDKWDALPADVRPALTAAGERELKTRWDVLPASMALEFARNGNRSNYEGLRNRRRSKLQDLAMAECAEFKGRFLDEIVNGIWLTCEETFWGIPAHLGAQKAKVGLPDVAEPIVDLFAAETASLLAWVLYLLEPQLKQVSPLVPARIRLETARRVLAPCLERDDFGWMGFKGGPPNNWNPWICSNWLTSALIVESDAGRKTAALEKIVRCLDRFLNGYADDGGCDEGPGYWGRAGASLFDCLELYDWASGGKLNGYREPLIREIGLYICRAHIAGDWYTNFSDAPAKVRAEGDLVYRYGKKTGSEVMAKHGAWSAMTRDERGIPRGTMGRQLPALFELEELRHAPRSEALLRDAWMPGIGVMTARIAESSAKGLYLAAQAGNNGKSHNHNDVGNFVVFADGLPVIIDVGVETYSAKTFSPKRYEIWTMQSAYHNCPTIDGIMQSPGRPFAASDVVCRQDERSAELQMDLAGAYPKDAGIESWKRAMRLDRSRNEVEITDSFRLKAAANEITLTLMTPCRVDPQGSTLRLDNRARISYDPAMTVTVEDIRLEDRQLQNVWGERLYRVLLHARNPPRSGTWSLKISQE